ncbi:EamA family transporter [Comamonas piscis]|uniref:EamA family transporter n=1 Tax=Comamonas piscis TaxID=1562974 RepID=A0A7G5EMS6_9BURK|nr:EamA family transporter [Comamonas piscis]QMV75301.1 EamA family transporter [Comamonas piscis]WSO33794.1 EamA family transporter [Comamonas piscis]
MKRFYLVGFLVLMAFDTLAQLSFKKAGDAALPLEFSPSWLWRVFAQPWIYGALIGYIGAFFTWMHLLRRAPVGPAFAASHLEIISVLVLSHYLFQENIGMPQMLGCVFIVAGIACLALSEAQDHGATEAVDTPADGTAGANAAAR